MFKYRGSILCPTPLLSHLLTMPEIVNFSYVWDGAPSYGNVQSCIIPRLLLSPEDAAFCAAFFHRMHELDMPGFITCFVIGEVTPRDLKPPPPPPPSPTPPTPAASATRHPLSPHLMTCMHACATYVKVNQNFGHCHGQVYG